MKKEIHKKFSDGNNILTLKIKITKNNKWKLKDLEAQLLKGPRIRAYKASKWKPIDSVVHEP